MAGCFLLFSFFLCFFFCSFHFLVFSSFLRCLLFPEEALVPWNGHTENLMSRFDCRCQLDVLPQDEGEDSVPSRPAARHTEEECEMEVLLNYERYRSIIENKSNGGTGLLMH